VKKHTALKQNVKNDTCVEFRRDIKALTLLADITSSGNVFHSWTTRTEQKFLTTMRNSKGKGSPYSTAERRVPELIPVLGSQPAGDVSHKPGGRPPLLSARPAVTPTTVKRAATNFAGW